MSTKLIQNFILQSEENLRIAAAVAETWPDVRRELMSSFLDRLDTRLTREGWKPWRNSDFLKPYADYYIAKPEWGESYWIGFECYPNWRQIDIGIYWEPGKMPEQGIAELLTALQKIHPSAKSHPGLRWVYAKLRSPEPDWSKPDVLWRMHNDPKFITDFANELLAIAKVTEHIIDRLVRNK
jgi:hypothetical protein